MGSVPPHPPVLAPASAPGVRSSGPGPGSDRAGDVVAFVQVSDAKLLERAAGGDARAFRQIYDRHALAVYRFLSGLLRDRAAADEATQETFVRAHARLRDVREGDKLLGFLL